MTLFLLALLQAGIAAPPEDNIGLGPMRIPSLGPFQSLRPGFTARTPSALRQGEFELRETETWVNLWSFNFDDWRVDGEVLHSALSLAWGIADDLVLEVEVNETARFGGRMDSFIDPFHDLTGADQRHREDYPRNEFRFEVNPRDGGPWITLDSGDRGSYTGAVLATLQKALLRGEAGLPDLSAALTLRGAFTHDDLGGSPVGASFSLSGARTLGSIRATLSLNLAWFGRQDLDGLDLAATQWFILSAIEWPLSGRTSILFQYLLMEGAVPDVHRFSDPSSELGLGLKTAVAPGSVLEFGLIENFFIPDNSPDFGLHAGMSVRF